METLIKEYEKPVYNAAYRMLGNSDDAADVTQTTFLKAFGKISQFDTSLRFFSWIYRIAINESINSLGKRATPGRPDELTISARLEPDRLAASGQIKQRLESVLADLSDEYRSVIVLRYFTGCHYAEIAQALRIPEKTVKSRLFTARRQMRALLEKQGIESA